MKKKSDEFEIELANKFDDLREFLKKEVYSRNKSTFDDESNFTKSNYDSVYDIDIFLTRKPGMRASIQLIMSDTKSREVRRLSFLTAISSLLDSAVDNGVVDEDDINQILVVRSELLKEKLKGGK